MLKYMVPWKETVPRLPAAPTHPRSRGEASLLLTRPPRPAQAGRSDLISSSLVSFCHTKFTGRDTCVVSWHQRSLQISWLPGRQAVQYERSRSHMRAHGTGVGGGHSSRRASQGQKARKEDCQPSSLQRASLIAQLVKNLPAMQETPLWFLGRKDPTGEGIGYPLWYSGLENSMDYSPWGSKELDMTEWLSLSVIWQL